MSLDRLTPEHDAHTEELSRALLRRIAKLEGDVLVLRAQNRHLADEIAGLKDRLEALVRAFFAHEAVQ